mmetsp:Transcript_8874/g.21269  ORF Transcript_8874/g.21269 Transcript_8874/m.21269 type:complete len:120 (-) Transcript_8874:404-763(-)
MPRGGGAAAGAAGGDNRSAMLAQIQGGAGGLRNAAERKIPEREAAAAPQDTRTALLDAIRTAGAKQLRSVDMEKVQAQKQAASGAPVKAGGLVTEMLRRRQALGDSEDDEDEDGWSDDD